MIDGPQFVFVTEIADSGIVRDQSEVEGGAPGGGTYARLIGLSAIGAR
jgi:hypothetical protein